MNTNLLNIVKQIVCEKGESILADSQKLKPLFKDMSKDEPKSERVAFGRCVEMGAYGELKSAGSVNERKRRKTALTEQMHATTGIDKTQCAEALDLLEAVLFGMSATPLSPPRVSSAPPPSSNVYFYYNPQAQMQKIFCGACGKQLTAGSQFCDICGTMVGAPMPNAAGGVQNFIPQGHPSAYQSDPERKLRHGFTSFVLWLGLLGSSITAIVYFFDLISDGGLSIEYLGVALPSLDLWTMMLGSIVNIIGYKLLIFNWRELGWKLIAYSAWCGVGIPAAYNFLFNRPYFMEEYFLYLVIRAVATAIGLAIFSGILSFRNAYNAKSTWEQLV